MCGERFVIACLVAVALGAVGLGVGYQHGTAQPDPAAHAVHVPQGRHDRYYTFLPGGASGEVVVLGLPSTRTLARIPVFETRAGAGYGRPGDLVSQALEASGGTSGDLSAICAGQTNSLADTRLFAVDKTHPRIARVSLTRFAVDRNGEGQPAIRAIPGLSGASGVVALGANTDLLAVAGEFRDDSGSRVAFVDPATLETRFLVRLPGNAYRCAADPAGRYVLVTSYNSELATTTGEMTSWIEDDMVAIDVKACRKALRDAAPWLGIEGKLAAKGMRLTAVDAGSPAAEAGLKPKDVLTNLDDEALIKALAPGATIEVKYTRDGKAGAAAVKLTVPTLTAIASPKAHQLKLAHFVPVPKNVGGVDVTPDGRYAIVASRGTESVQIIQIGLLATASSPRMTVVAGPRLGWGPASTTFDGKGRAYTACVEGSEIVQWDVTRAVRDGDRYIIARTKAHYTPAGIVATRDGTAATGEYVLALCGRSGDQYPAAGAHVPGNLEVFGTTGTFRRLTQIPWRGRLSSAVSIKSSRLAPQIIDAEKAPAPKNGVSRDGDKVAIALSVARGELGDGEEIKVTSGDKIELTLTNLERVPGIPAGVGVSGHVVDVDLLPGARRTVRFTAGAPGVYWIHLTRFNGSIAPETRVRLLVSAKK